MILHPQFGQELPARQLPQRPPGLIDTALDRQPERHRVEDQAKDFVDGLPVDGLPVDGFVVDGFALGVGHRPTVRSRICRWPWIQSVRTT